MRMLLQGIIWIYAFILPTACSIENYYAISHPPSSSNLTCERDSRIFEPCGTLEQLHFILYSYKNKDIPTSIYLLDSEYNISGDIHFNFSSLEFVEIRAWKRNTTSSIICNNHPFSVHFLNIDKIIIESIGFHNCGKFEQITGTIVVELITSILSPRDHRKISPRDYPIPPPRRNRQYYRSIKSSVRELQVTNCIFNEGKATSIYIEGNSVTNATFKNVHFKHNEAGSILLDTSHECNLVISNCIFYNSSTYESVVKVMSIHSVAITCSLFSNNSVGSILSTYETDKVVIADCYIDSNNVTYNTISTISGYSCGCESIQSVSLFTMSDTIAINNINEINMLNVKGFQSIKILNCTFTKNIGGSSLMNANEIAINQTNFEGNKGIAVEIWSYHNILIVDNCKFAFNTAKDSGAAISSQFVSKLVIIQRSVFIGNQAKINGGAIQTRSNEIRVIGSQFFNNSALMGDGGAMWISGNLYVTSSCFSFNRAASGGAVCLNEGPMDFQLATFYDSQFIQNIATDKGGGSVVIKGNKIEFCNCNFQENTAFSPEGKGGAINVISSASLIVNHTNFTANSGSDGGALNIEKSQRVVVWDCYFTYNTAKWNGGAILMTKDITEVNLYGYSNFFNNSAKNGGAMAFNANGLFSKDYCCNNKTKSWLDYSIEEITHQYNSNNFTGINHFNVTVITNCSFTNNEANRRDQGRGGAIAAQGDYHAEFFPRARVFNKSNADRIFLRHCTFKENTAAIGGGIYSNNSRLFIGTTDFHQNSAKLHGAGISSELSWVCFEGKVNIISNYIISNSGKGGAIYSENKCEVNLCPLLWTNQTSLNFAGNSAAHGSMLYGGMLDRCEDLPGQTLKSALKMLTSDLDRYRWSSDVVTSTATNFCYKSNCSKRTRKEVLYPGQSFNVTVGCLDQLHQPLNNCLIQSQYKSTGFLLGSGENKRTIDGFEDLMFQLTSNRKGAAILTMSSNISCTEDMWKNLEVKIDVGSCPLGFQLQDKRCDCDNRLLKTSLNIECSINNEVIILSQSGWLSYKDGLLRTHFDCPLDYCLQTKKYISPFQPDTQCANNRGGVLCGECLANYSVVLGSWKCMKCTHTARYNFIWLTVVMTLAGVVLVMFLLLVKMTVSSGTINGLIFYANIVSFSGLLDHQKCIIHPFLHVFISWINLDLGIEVCFYLGMDVYQKTWLQFVFPFYIWFLVGVIVLVCHYSSTVMKLMGMRNIEVLATLFLLSYAKLLKTIVTALSVTNIMVASADNRTDPLRPHKVWVYDGNIDYFGSKHLPLFIVAVLFLFTLFMPYTLFLLCGQWRQYVPRKRGFRWIHSTFISAIMDAYHAPYTKHHRYWTGLGLLIRCCLFTIFGTSYSTGINLMSTIVAVILLQVIRIASSGKVYRNKVVGLLELFYLSNLGILATVLLVNNTLCAASTVSVSLSFIIFVGTLLHHFHQETKQNSLYKIVKKFFYKMVILLKTKWDTSENEQKNVISEQGSTTSYFELRESLIDSTV